MDNLHTTSLLNAAFDVVEVVDVVDESLPFFADGLLLPRLSVDEVMGGPISVFMMGEPPPPPPVLN